MLPYVVWLASLFVSALSRNLVVDYFMTSETQYLDSRCCKSDNTDLVSVHPESALGNDSSLFLNFTINRNLLRHTREKSLCSAELRLYQQGQTSRISQRVEVLLRGEHVLDSKKMGHNVRGWKNFNVYDAFTENNFPEEAVPNTRNKVLIRFEIRPHKLESREHLTAQFKSGIVGEHKPRIFLKSCRQSKRKVVNNLGPRRYDNHDSDMYSANEPSYWTTSQDEGKCGVRLLYLQFEKDMSIPSIRAPQGVDVNYCAGSCPYLWKTENPPLHTLILGQFAEQIKESRYEPCCVPASYDFAEAITTENQIIKFDNLRVTSCKCV